MAKNAIKIGKRYLPQAVRAAAQRINRALAEYEGEFQVSPYDFERLYISRPSKWDKGEKEYLIAENSEGGASSTVYRNGEWFYREPWEGYETPIKNGVDEVVANWICYFTG